MAILRLSITRTGIVHSFAASNADSYVADIAAESVATTIEVAPASWAARKHSKKRSGEGRDVVTGRHCSSASTTRAAC